MVHQLPRLKAQGYSKAVLDQLMKSRVQSSNDTYESRWKVFERFAQSRDFNPFEGSPAQVAEFLLFLAEERKVSWGTIAGYRSALGHVLRLVSGYDPGSCEILTQLMKSFKRTQPISARRVPEWDVSLVLSVLLEEKAKNENLSLHLLTAKAVFLIALASAERRSAIAALKFPPLFYESEMVVKFDESYIPKSYFVRRNLARISPLRVLRVPTKDWIQVCPCATVQFYCDKVANLRDPVQTSLFIPHNLTKKTNISVQAIARYIVKLVEWCYMSVNESNPGCKAHDVRKIAASMRALTSVSLSDVMSAGGWSTPSVFLSHYKVDLHESHETHSKLENCQIVAGKSIYSFSLQKPELQH